MNGRGITWPAVAEGMTRVVPFITLARPSHWIKNVIVFAPIVFGLRMADPGAWIKCALAAISFCLACSAAYIVNDLRDRENDRRHPEKSKRPLACGAVSMKAAVWEAVILVLLSWVVALTVNGVVALLVTAYMLMQHGYTFFLKQKMLLDVICIACGFVLRAVTGATAIGVEVSPWLIICTFAVCLFMGFCKRRTELATLDASGDAGQHRKTLIRYSPELLTHLITLSAGIAVVTYLLYASNPRTEQHLGTVYLIYTLPLVVYAVFRFAMLSIEARYADPTELILHDRPFQLVVIVWSAAAVSIVTWGPALRHWLEGLQ